MTLPDKPSELIRVALKDLAAAERDPRYCVSMNHAWHAGAPVGDRCSVCLAGAVMAGTLGADPRDSLNPSSFLEDGVAAKLRALDVMRFGGIPRAVVMMGYERTKLEGPDWIGRIAYYDRRNPAPFHASMATMADRLEGVGL